MKHFRPILCLVNISRVDHSAWALEDAHNSSAVDISIWLITLSGAVDLYFIKYVFGDNSRAMN